MSARCPFGACDGDGIVVDEQTRVASHCRCHGQVVARRTARGLSAVVPRRYRDLSFDAPPITAIRPTIVAQVRSFAARIDDALDEGRGLWLFGPVGTGKTSLAMLVSSAALTAGRSVAIYSLPRLLAEIRTTFEGSSTSSYAQFLDRLGAVDLLHLDDVGAEKTSDWVLEQLYTIINQRYESQRSIIITTNLEQPQLIDQIGARSVSRLEEMCAVLPVAGADLRAQVHAYPRAS